MTSICTLSDSMTSIFSIINCIDKTSFPTKVKSHRTTSGRILCTGKGCFGCNPYRYIESGQQHLINDLKIDDADIDNPDQLNLDEAQILRASLLMNCKEFSMYITSGSVDQCEASGDSTFIVSPADVRVSDKYTSEKGSAVIQEYSKIGSQQHSASRVNAQRAYKHNRHTASSFQNTKEFPFLKSLLTSNAGQGIYEAKGLDYIRKVQTSSKHSNHTKGQCNNHETSPRTKTEQRHFDRKENSQCQRVKPSNRKRRVGTSVDKKDLLEPSLDKNNVSVLIFRHTRFFPEITLTDMGRILEDNIGSLHDVIYVGKRERINEPFRILVKSGRTKDVLIENGIHIQGYLYKLEEIEKAI